MHLIGLDPGFASIGYAILKLPPLRVTGTKPFVVSFGVMNTEKSEKKQKVLSVEDNVRRAIEIARFFRALLASAPNTLAFAAEAMSFPRSASPAAKMAMCWGALASLSDATNTPILQASPQHVKREVTGYKTATKEEVQTAMVRAYPEIVALRVHINEGRWEHCHDALAVAHVMLESDVVRMARRAA